MVKVKILFTFSIFVLSTFTCGCNSSNKASKSQFNNVGGLNQGSREIPKARICPQDAKICPDGSSVTRSGSNCEFAACPP